MLRIVSILLLGITAQGAAEPNPQQPLPDCTIYNDCMTCQNAKCNWFNSKCIAFNGAAHLALGPCPGQTQQTQQTQQQTQPLDSTQQTQPTNLDYPPQQTQQQTNLDYSEQTPTTPPKGCKPACKSNFRCVKGKCVARLVQPAQQQQPEQQPEQQPQAEQPQEGDCPMQNSTAFIKNGERFQNPETCATLLCFNGSLGMLDCASSQCPNGDIMQCDPNNQCLPTPCGVSQGPLDCAAAFGFPLIKHGTSWRDPMSCRTHVCNNGLISLSDCAINFCADGTSRMCDPLNSCIAPSCLASTAVTTVVAAPLGCLLQGTFPALAHGESWRDPLTCHSFQCNNGVRIETFCAATICSNGEVRPCEPALNCQPRACSPDCLASGEFPFLRHGQSYFDTRTCNTYTCSNRVAVRQSCTVSICSNGEVRPCDPTNRCLPMACSSGNLLLLPAPLPTVVRFTSQFPLLSLTWGTADCPALGLIPYLRHGQSFTDMSTCTIRTCINGVTTSQASCLQNVCLGGLQPCDPTNMCLSRLCPV